MVKLLRIEKLRSNEATLMHEHMFTMNYFRLSVIRDADAKREKKNAIIFKILFVVVPNINDKKIFLEHFVFA